MSSVIMPVSASSRACRIEKRRWRVLEASRGWVLLFSLVFLFAPPVGFSFGRDSYLAADSHLTRTATLIAGGS